MYGKAVLIALDTSVEWPFKRGCCSTTPQVKFCVVERTGKEHVYVDPFAFNGVAVTQFVALNRQYGEVAIAEIPVILSDKLQKVPICCL